MLNQQIGNGTFWLGDCFDVMQTLPDASVDLIVTSPPYDNLREYTGEAKWSYETFCKIAKEICRILKDGGVIVWVVGDETIKGSESGSSFRQALFFIECGLNLHDTMIWNKGGFSAVGSLVTRYAPVFEYMFVFSKGKPKSFNPIKDRENKHGGKKASGTIRQKDGSTKPMSKVMTIGEFGQRFNIWEISPQRQSGEGKHPAPFPESIAADHILSWSNENDLVVDPFGGSGTTALAAEKLNRKWITCEISEQYANAAVERIKNHLAEPNAN